LTGSFGAAATGGRGSSGFAGVAAGGGRTVAAAVLRKKPHMAVVAGGNAKARGATWKVVISYMPPFQSCLQYPQGQKMRVLVDLLETAGVDLVFSGYAHSYQRTFPLRFTPDARPTGPVTDPGHLVPGQFALDKRFDGREHTHADGIVYIVSGCGGNPQLHSPEQTDQPATWQPFTVRYNARLHQFTALEIDGSRLKLKQISREGAILDELTLTKGHG